MDGLLDDERLDGAHEAHISYRPARVALPVRLGEFRTQVEQACQAWGGAARPLLPVGQDGRISDLWSRILPGSAIDTIAGSFTGNLDHPEGIRIPAQERASDYIEQLAVALLPYRPASGAPKVEVVTLAPDDPWDEIYAACLGTLPLVPDAEHLRYHQYVRDLRFDDFVDVSRVDARGSLDDLLDRLTQRGSTTPRRLSMLDLVHGTAGRMLFRTKRTDMPTPHFVRQAAGPNVVVVCTPGNVHDLALLWNLRAAHGDHLALPIGIPAAELSADTLSSIQTVGSASDSGRAHRPLYVTSTSVTTKQLANIVGQQDAVEVVTPFLLADFARPGEIGRDEVLVWSDGKARLQTVPQNTVQKLFDRGTPSRFARMYVDVQVYDSPLPDAPDYRVRVPNAEVYAGSRSRWLSLNRASNVEEIEWPSRLLMARSLAAARGHDLKESEPGRACRFALAGLGSIDWLDLLAHAPLLSLLEEMAAREGFGWYKKLQRTKGNEVHALDNVGPTVDVLPRRTFNDFKKVLGRNDRATRQWLVWAEESTIVVKGFEIACPVCGAKQWMPVSAFAPPITCRGCASPIEHPFGHQTTVSFQYRLSERMRRVFECDAMGHLLLARYFHRLFWSSPGSGPYLIGMSPGMEVRESGAANALGEADLLMLNWAGEFIPAEYKRSASGLTDTEITKLDALCTALRAPWSVVAYGGYIKDAEQDVSVLERRDESGVRTRAVLSYDQLLDPHPIRLMNKDSLQAHPLTAEEIGEREGQFVQGLAKYGANGEASWLETEMLRRDGF